MTESDDIGLKAVSDQEGNPKGLNRESFGLYKQIADIWRQKIISGEYKAGDILPSEREIAAELNVSRIPVREAMKSLEYIGVVRQVRGQGVYVKKADLGELLRIVGPMGTKPDPVVFNHLFDFRLLIEPYAVEQAARLATPEEVARMKATIDEAKAFMAAGKDVEIVSFDFHLAVMQASHNEIIVLVSQFLAELLKLSRHYTQWNRVRRKEACAYHERIYKLIRDHKAEEAAAMLRQHLEDARVALTCKEGVMPRGCS